jgi:hypothetical protein
MLTTRTVSPVTRRRLEAQGFVGLDDAALAEVGPWLRLAPALCSAWAAVGTALGSPGVIWALMPFAALGTVVRGHPFDVIYNHGIRHLLGTRRLPPYNAPRRFACAVATVWLGATGWAFYAGATLLGYVLGAALAVAALVPTLTNFCIPSFFYGLLFRKPAACARTATTVLEPKARLGQAAKGDDDEEETMGKPREPVLRQVDVAGAQGGPWRDDLVAAILGTTLVCGLFLDGWNHINLQNGALGSFFTIWHALLYAGFSATTAWVITRNPHLYSTGNRPKGYFHPVSGSRLAQLHPAFGIPLRYPFAVTGIVIAMIGLFGDLVWHTAFGEEVGVARVIAPFHLLLFAGAVGLVAAPLRSGWYAPQYYPSEPSFRIILPPLLSLTLATAVAAFMFQWLSVFVDWRPSIQYGRIPAELAHDDRIVGVTEFAGVARVLVTNVILLAPLLLALKRWRLPFGSVSFMFATVATLMCALTQLDLGGTILAAVVGGLTADGLIRWLRPGLGPGVESRYGFRIVAGLVPVALWTAYFLVLRAVHGIVWPLDLWIGTTMLAAIMGFLLSFVAVAPATPVPYAERAGPLTNPAVDRSSLPGLSSPGQATP